MTDPEASRESGPFFGATWAVAFPLLLLLGFLVVTASVFIDYSRRATIEKIIQEQTSAQTGGTR